MSAERVVSPAPSSRMSLRILTALVVGIAIGAAIVLLVRDRPSSTRRVAARAASPDKSLVAIAFDTPCQGGTCHELAIGPSDDRATAVSMLTNQRCDEVVWSPDGRRVGFLIGGQELSLYDAHALKLAGTIRLMTSDAARERLARGITFSENGRAITFDDCPRGRSGCRAGVVGVPQ
jgi:hypothetical protein